MKKLTTRELKRLVEVCDYLENEIKLEFINFSGAFAVAELFDYDDELIDIELKFGIQSDCNNSSYSEQYTVDRKGLLKKDKPIEELIQEAS